MSEFLKDGLDVTDEMFPSDEELEKDLEMQDEMFDDDLVTSDEVLTSNEDDFVDESNPIASDEDFADEDVDLDLSEFQFAQSEYVPRELTTAGVITTVNKGSRRLELAKTLIDEIGDPDSIQVAFGNDTILIGGKIWDNQNNYNLKKSGAKKVAYAGELVQEVTKIFSLDFTNKTSITFHEVKYVKLAGKKVAIIQVR